LICAKLLAKAASISRLTSRNLGEPVNNRPFTLLLGSTSCGNRPVRRATHFDFSSFVVLWLSSLAPCLGFASARAASSPAFASLLFVTAKRVYHLDSLSLSVAPRSASSAVAFSFAHRTLPGPRQLHLLQRYVAEQTTSTSSATWMGSLRQGTPSGQTSVVMAATRPRQDGGAPTPNPTSA
jgi:hypothetical protein